MKNFGYLFISIFIIKMINSCAPRVYGSNGESIYQSGKNLSGIKLLDNKNSQITLFRSCAGCHGSSGKAISDCNIQWSYLTNPYKMKVPYTKEFFYRFIDQDIKSDGTMAQTGVHWNMSKNDKEDLIFYLKTLR